MKVINIDKKNCLISLVIIVIVISRIIVNYLKIFNSLKYIFCESKIIEKFFYKELILKFYYEFNYF